MITHSAKETTEWAVGVGLGGGREGGDRIGENLKKVGRQYRGGEWGSS